MRGGTDRLLHVPLAIPGDGEAVRAVKGDWQIVVERSGDDLLLLAHNGRRARRWVAPVPSSGRLELWVRAPRHPVRLHFTDVVTLAPRGQVEGFVGLPMPLEVMWIGDNGSSEALAELVPSELQTSWLGAERGYVHEVQSGFSVEGEGGVDPGKLLVPLELCNTQNVAITPESALLDVRTSDLRVAGSRVCCSRRSVVFGGDYEMARLPRGPRLKFLVLAMCAGLMSAGCSGEADLGALEQRVAQVEAENARLRVEGPAQVAALEQRVAELEASQEQVEAALDRTAELLGRLFAMLQRTMPAGEIAAALPESTPQAEPEATPAEEVLAAEPQQPTAQPTATAQPTEEAQPAEDDAGSGLVWWWWAGPMAAVVGLVLWLVRRAGVDPVDPVAVEPPPPAPAPPPARLTPVQPPTTAELPVRAPEYPREVALELEHPQPQARVSVLESWLAEDPRVLLLPAPEIGAENGILQVRYWLAPGLPPAEVENVEAEVTVLGRGRSDADEDTQALGSTGFLQGNAGG